MFECAICCYLLECENEFYDNFRAQRRVPQKFGLISPQHADIFGDHAHACWTFFMLMAPSTLSNL